MGAVPCEQTWGDKGGDTCGAHQWGASAWPGLLCSSLSYQPWEPLTWVGFGLPPQGGQEQGDQAPSQPLKTWGELRIPLPSTA